ncbi:MAG: hypothetical protein ACLR56_14605 [Oscillospiraceae bacterium]
MPVSVGLLNRFVSPKEQAKIIADLKCGRLDMVVVRTGLFQRT